MTRDRNRQPCLDPETLAAFAEGRLRRQEIAAVLAHLRHCPACTKDVAAIASDAKRGAGSRGGPLYAAAW